MVDAAPAQAAAERGDLSRLAPPVRKLEARLESGLLLPLSRGARSTLADAPVVGLRLRVSNLLGARWAVALGASAFGGTGATPGLDQPYDVFGLHVQAGLGRTFDLGRSLYLEPQASVGTLWLRRAFRSLTVHETLRALTLSPAVELGAVTRDALSVSLRFEASVFTTHMEGPRAVHAVGQMALLAGYSF